jgi:transposase-like protein
MGKVYCPQCGWNREAAEQRCWVHKIANVIDKLPKKVQPRAKKMIHEAMCAPTRKACDVAIDAFVAEHEPKYPRAAECFTKDRERLATLFDFPAEHWKHLRSTNPIESTFATVKLRTRVTKGAGSRAAGLAMAFKLMLAAERTWRRLDAPHHLPLVRANVAFPDGVKSEREETSQQAKPIRKAQSRKSAERSAA